jgi:hypothetical protein
VVRRDTEEEASGAKRTDGDEADAHTKRPGDGNNEEEVKPIELIFRDQKIKEQEGG